MEKVNILWADDEIDLLKPHILFLNEKGYQVYTVNNGNEAIEKVQSLPIDIVLLDENMPGISGIETLSKIKSLMPEMPVIMITKSEEESIMEEAIGSKITDYLIKPVNPNQILLVLKKNLEQKRLVKEKTNLIYQQEFRNIALHLSDVSSWSEWVEVYKKLTFWELELQNSSELAFREILKMQKKEANMLFSRFIEDNYLNWLANSLENKPEMSHTIMKNRVLPDIYNQNKPVFFILIDNLRFDQWKVLQPIISDFFRVEKEDLYCSILPTATQYARNSIFAGMLPSDIEKKFPDLWLNDEQEGGKNMHEADFLSSFLKNNSKITKFSYHKVTNFAFGKKLVDNISNLLNNQLNVIVYNFVDMLSHARTEIDIIRELADDEPAYRSITLSWFEHSPLFEILKFLSEKKCRVIITTDHGTIKVIDPVKIVGDKNVNTNLRYKQGKSLDYAKKDVFEIKNPALAGLPRQHVSTSFVFAKEDSFFAYPNNYNHYVSYYRNTFQHGGISMEEMIIPYVVLDSK